MVKLFAFIRRRPDLSAEEFHAHWRDRHGPLIADTPELARHVVRYEQHPRHHPGRRSGSDGIDGVAVQWFESMDHFRSFLTDPAYAELVAVDERRFIDTDRIEYVITDEPAVIIDGPRSESEQRGAQTS